MPLITHPLVRRAPGDRPQGAVRGVGQLVRHRRHARRRGAWRCSTSSPRTRRSRSTCYSLSYGVGDVVDLGQRVAAALGDAHRPGRSAHAVADHRQGAGARGRRRCSRRRSPRRHSRRPAATATLGGYLAVAGTRGRDARMPTANAASTAVTTSAPISISRPSAQASTAGSSSLATVNPPTARLIAGHRAGHHPRRDDRGAVGAPDQPADPDAVDAVDDQHAQHEQRGDEQRVGDAAEAARGEREQRRLRHRVERQREQRADRRHRPRPAHGDEAAQQPALEARRRDDRVRARRSAPRAR